ncbi:acetyl-CoA synthetase-like protein [Phellopilus nigrolimitatus]|nr:acetyl-CoA synthetase-like protein [Phellopilus nigrolimitatus]
MAPLAIPRTHGRQSTTFTQPPLDESLSLPALYDWQAEHSPKHPLFVFEDVPGSQRTILWEEGAQGVHRATRFVRQAVGNPPASNGGGKPPVIAVLASSDTITFSVFIVGAMRTGCTIFCISPRNSSAAVTTLLAQTGAAHLFVSADASLQTLASAALDDLSAESPVQKHEMAVFEDFFPTKGCDPDFTPEPLAEIDMDAPAAIFHSSGSTAFPKPINFTHRALIWAAVSVCFTETDIAGTVLGCHSIAMFHGMGLFVLFEAAACGITAAVFKPHFPPTVPNPANVIEGIITSKSDYIFSTPTFPETWSHDSAHVDALAKMRGIIYSGGPLSKEAGNHLASKGVHIFTIYGLTETLMVNEFLHSLDGEDWDYFRISPAREAHFIDNGNNEFELVFLATDFFRPSAINTKINGRDAFATSDLVVPHPTKPGYWKVVGRTDDQIMHSTGEKTNPGPLEKMLARDPLVSYAVIFGRGRFHCGVLVEPKEQHAFNPTDTKKLVEFRNRIWPTIEAMNEFARTHSRIFKEARRLLVRSSCMILVASPSKPFALTGKGTLRRQVIIKEYDGEIDAAYKTVDESAQENIAGPEDWTLSHTTEFVRQIVLQTMKKENGAVADDADLFEHGLDSLQATWIRNTALRVLRESHVVVARKLSATFVYDYPTIARLATYLSSSVSGTAVDPAGDATAKSRELEALVSKYTTDFPTFVVGKESRDGGDGDIVLLTGSTGSIGSNILAKLIESKAVKRIYAMSRPSADNVSVKERHSKAFKRESLDSRLLEDARVRFLEGDASHPDFAIDPKQFVEVMRLAVVIRRETKLINLQMQTSVTHIIHNAWRVDFNVAVTSFEPNIRSVRNFVDFALGGHGAAPARVLFISSVGVFSNYAKDERALEEPLATPDTAIGAGYTESKWVSEHILQVASEKTPLSASVVRCGQMSGGPSGAWNTHEWFPSLVKSSIALRNATGRRRVVRSSRRTFRGSLRTTREERSSTCYTRATSCCTSCTRDHVPWSTIITSFASELGLPRAPYAVWLAALEAAHAELYSGSEPSAKVVAEAHATNPALRLRPFLHAAVTHMARVKTENVEPLGITRLRCERAEAASATLREAPEMGAANVKTWVENWRASRFIALALSPRA